MSTATAFRSAAIPAPTRPRGAYFTRGTTKDRYARYSEEGSDYVDNMQRLLRKFETAKALVPQPVLRRCGRKTRFGAIYYGSTSPAMDEASPRSRPRASRSMRCACAPSRSATR